MIPNNIKQENIIAVGQALKEKKYWQEVLSGELEKAFFPYDFNGTSKEISEHFFEIKGEIFSKVHNLSRGSLPMTYMILVASLKSLIFKYIGNNDIVVGSPVEKQKDNRNLINTVLPLRSKISNDTSFKELLLQTRGTIIKAIENQNYPFEIIVNDLKNGSADNNSNPLFDIAIHMENLHNRKYLENSGASVIFSFNKHDDKIEGKIEYKTALYKKETINKIGYFFMYLLEQILFETDKPFKDISLTKNEEIDFLLNKWNDTQKTYPSQNSIIDLIEKQAQINPERIAVVEKSNLVTYKELNEKANQLANSLKNKGIKKGEIIGILLDRSINFVISTLGVLKAECCFLPIDIESKEERIKYIIEDSGCNLFITHKKFNPESLSHIERICIDSDDCLSQDNSALIRNYSEKETAYVIYTSGTSGTPKGTLIQHKGFFNYIYWASENYTKDEPLSFPLFTSVSFDLTITSIFTPLISGGTIHIYGKNENNILIQEILKDNRVNIIKLTPSHLKLIRTFKINGESNKQSIVKRLIVGGEQLETKDASDIFNNFERDIEIFNEYGPTEATVGCMVYKYNEQDKGLAVPIGKPIANTQIYLLNKYLELVPKGIQGEMYISGSGLAAAYHKKPELTEAKFIDNPFVLGERMYKTGDLAKMNDIDDLEFIGRVDQQIKIRGYRVELGEIEIKIKNWILKTLNYSDSSVDVIVVDRKDTRSDLALCSYFTADKKIDIPDLKEYLFKDLPDYMVPTYFIQIDKIPLTLNGKVDKKLLPEPTLVVEAEYIAPITENHREIVEIWSDLLELNVNEIGIRTNFFKLGGHSLKATILISEIEKKLSVKISMLKFFENPTIEGISNFLETQEKVIHSPIKKVKQKDHYSLSSAQKRLFFLYEFDKMSTAYNIPLVFNLEGEVDRAHLNNVFNRLIERHESLRTSIEVINDSAMQKISNQINFEIEYFEASTERSQAIAKNFIRPFDLSKAPLLRAGLIKTATDKHIFMVDIHHVISDIISQKLLLQDFVALYNGEKLPELSLQYKDYSEWQMSEEQQKRLLKQKEFWLKEFAEETNVLELPTDFTRPSIQKFEGNSVGFELGYEETNKLKSIIKKEGATLFMGILSVFNILLSKLTNQEDIVVGTPVAGRPNADLKHIIGMFVNTLPIRNYPKGELSFIDFLAEVKTKSLQCIENQYYQYEDIIDDLKVQRETSRNPLFDVMLAFQEFDRTELSLPGLTLSPNNYEYSDSKFDLTLYAKESNEQIFFHFEYSTALFRKETIERFIGYFKQIVSTIIDGTNKKISEIEIIDAKEKHQLLYKFNDTAVDYPKDKCIHQLFEEQVEKTPNNVAAVFEEKELIYSELNEKANQLAHYLQSKGVKQDSLVGICVERSFEMVVGILGILKAGGAYVPIDPTYPEERISYMFEDSGSLILLTQKSLKSTLPENKNIEKIYLDSESVSTKLNYESTRNAVSDVHPSNLIYVIYTSGSTGKPKGVMLEHKNLVNLINFTFTETNIDLSSVLQFASLSFDVSAQEIFSTLLNGGKLCLIASEARLNLTKLFNVISKNSVKTVYWPVSLTKMIFINEHTLIPKCIDHIITAGEQLIISKKFSEYLKINNIYLHNHYGPSETHVVTTLTINPKDEYVEYPSIGRPISNTSVFILNKDLNLVPVNIIGEIYLSGSQIGRGYQKQPELTKEKFIKNPLSSDPESILYKTGDLGRFLPNGEIEFLGRIDDQVKIRGFRIELGEIESLLALHGTLKESVVVIRGTESDKYLVAYYVSEDEINTSEIRAYLLKNLPDYMIPSYFIRLESIPLTPSGKINRKSLPNPEIKAGINFISPSNSIEEKLVEIWSEILKIEKSEISTNISFFDLGGHSLKAILLVNKIFREMNVEIPIREVFKYQDVISLSRFIHEAGKSVYSTLEKAEIKEYYKTTSTQKQLYFLNEFNIQSLAYNVSQVVILEGDLNVNKLTDVFIKLIARHENLRTSFHMINGEPVQKILGNHNFEIESFQSSEEESQTIIKKFITPFDLSKAPLLKVGIIKITTHKHILMVDMHHIISDGTSQELLIKDFMSFYNNEKLPELKLQFKDYSEWQNSQKGIDELIKQSAYWTDKFKEGVPALNIPTDYDRNLVQNFEGAALNFQINSDLSLKIKSLCKQENITEFMFFISVYTILWNKILNREKNLLIGVGTFGRNHPDLHDIIGMFVNTLPFCIDIQKDMLFVEFLKEVKKHALQLLSNQESRIEELLLNKDLKKIHPDKPLFEAAFVWQNFDQNELQLNSSNGFEIQIKPVINQNNISKFDITLYGQGYGNEFNITFEYSTELFNENTIMGFKDIFLMIVENVLKEPTISINKIDILPKGINAKLLEIESQNEMEDINFTF